MRLLRRLLPVILAITIILSGFTFSSAADSFSYDAFGSYYFSMWHYSGLYWKIGNASDNKETVNDSDITLLDKAEGIMKYLNGDTSAVKGGKVTGFKTVDITVPLSAEAYSRVVSGDYSVTSTISDSMYKKYFKNWTNVADMVADRTVADISQTNKIIFRNLELIYNANDDSVGKNPTFTLYGVRQISDADPTKGIPMVGAYYTYGYNVYSMYGKGYKAKDVDGYFQPGNTSLTSGTLMHHSYIKDSTGALYSGHTISVAGKSYDSGDWCVGSGTYKKAGACGCTFYFPIKLTITSKVNNPPTAVQGSAVYPGTKNTFSDITTEDDYDLLMVVNDIEHDNLKTWFTVKRDGVAVKTVTQSGTTYTNTYNTSSGYNAVRVAADANMKVAGNYTVEFWTQETAGDMKVCEKSCTFSYKVDQFTPPPAGVNQAPSVVSITTDPTSLTVGGSYNLVVSVTDKDFDSPLTVETLLKRGKTEQLNDTRELEINPDGKTYPSITFPSLTSEAGTYYVTVRVTDPAGLSATKTYNFSVGSADAKANLVLSENTIYEGHNLIAYDRSTYEVDGESYSASEAYKEGIASNDWDLDTNIDGHKGTYTSGATQYRNKKDVTFDYVGDYTITLTAEPSVGEDSTVVENIVIL